MGLGACSNVGLCCIYCLCPYHTAHLHWHFELVCKKEIGEEEIMTVREYLSKMGADKVYAYAEALSKRALCGIRPPWCKPKGLSCMHAYEDCDRCFQNWIDSEVPPEVSAAMLEKDNGE